MRELFRPEVLLGSLLWASLTFTVTALLLRWAARRCPGLGGTPFFFRVYAFLPLRLLLPVPAPWGALPESALWGWLLLVWGAGALAVFGASLLRTFFCYRRIVAEEEAVPEELSGEFVSARRHLGIRSRPVLLVTHGVASPMLIGTIRPLVVIPGAWARRAGAELRCLLFHELTHFKNGDLLMGWLWTLAGAVHWFNALIPGILKQARFYRELRCDDMVCRKLPAEVYGRTLLDFAASPVRFAGAASLAEEPGELELRIGRLAERKSLRKGRGWLAVAMLLICGSLLPFSAPGSEAKERYGKNAERIFAAFTAGKSEAELESILTPPVAAGLKKGGRACNPFQAGLRKVR